MNYSKEKAIKELTEMLEILRTEYKELATALKRAEQNKISWKDIKGIKDQIRGCIVDGKATRNELERLLNGGETK